MSERLRREPALPARRSAGAASLEALVGAITSEIRLLEELIGVMRRQRAAVAEDDLQGVDDSVFATHRILVTLAEARRQRRALGELIAGTDDLGLRTLDEVLGDRMSDSLRDARDGLQAAAIILSREIEINRNLLRSALSTSGEMMHALYAPAEAGATYRPDQHPAEKDSTGGILLDRQI
jgi:hypothetical protein